MFSKPTLALTLTSNFALWCIWTLRVLGLSSGSNFYIFFESYTDFPSRETVVDTVLIGRHSMGSVTVLPQGQSFSRGSKMHWLEEISIGGRTLDRPLLTVGSRLIGHVGYPNITRPNYGLPLYQYMTHLIDPTCDGEDNFNVYAGSLHWHYNCIPVAQLTLDQIFDIANQMIAKKAQQFCDTVNSIQISDTVSHYVISHLSRTLYDFKTTEIKQGCQKYGYNGDNWHDVYRHDEGRRYLTHLQGQPDCTSVVASWVFMVNKTTTVDAYSPTACCKMAGVTCEGSKVTKIDWSNKGLKRNIPSFFGQLSDLKYL